VESVESPALTQQDGQPLAMRVHWQLGTDSDVAPGHKVAIHMGQLFASYAPGFLTEVQAYFSQVWASQDTTEPGCSVAPTHDTLQGEGSSGQQESSSGATEGMTAEARLTGRAQATNHQTSSRFSQTSEQPAQNAESNTAPPAWLTGGTALSASVLSLQLGILSSQGTQAEAFLLSVDRCSMHLGPFKPSARPGSLLAELFSLQKQALSGTGLRVALSGVQLCAATHWMHAASRAGEAEAVLMATGAEAVSGPLDLLALVSLTPAAGQPDNISERQEALDSWILSAALSPVSMQLSGLQLAAVSAAAQGVQAESRTGFSKPLQERVQPLPSREDTQRARWLTGAALHVKGLWLMYSPAGAAQHVSKLNEWQNRSQQASICQADIVMVSAQSAAAQACVSVSVRQPMLAANPGVQLNIPIVELSAERWPSLTAARHSDGAPPKTEKQDLQRSSGGTVSPAAADCLPLLYVHDIQTCLSSSSMPQHKGEMQLATTVDTASFGICPLQLELLVRPLHLIRRSCGLHSVPVNSC